MLDNMQVPSDSIFYADDINSRKKNDWILKP